jgi:hypothetical protein
LERPYNEDVKSHCRMLKAGEVFEDIAFHRRNQDPWQL